MKPINLKIKGLNSFMEPQEVDFEKLTNQGLFGIFGPTGSGKSTILDGITLALYGEVARKSTNFMNTNCDSLMVSYEFQITEKETKRYRVEREYRRDKKTDSIRSKSAKILFINGENEIILEEQAKAVTEKCEEIIGLKLEDFTRTVVLPQGNFSEFLKLSGKDRRNMLERLFNLQKYGDELSFKLGRTIGHEKEKAGNLNGELKAYEDSNEELLQEEKNTLEKVENIWKQSKEESEAAEEKFRKGKEVWELQLELKAETIKENKLKVREGEIHEYEKVVSLGESALKIEPHMKRYEETHFEMEKCKEELESLNKLLNELTTKRENQKLVYEIAKNRKENELSNLKLKRQQIMEAIDEEKILKDLLKETEILEERIFLIDNELITINQKIKENELELEKQNAEITKKEEEIEILKIPEVYKQKINEAVVLSKSFDNLKEQKEQLQEEIHILSAELEDGKFQRNEKFIELQKNKEALGEKQKELENLNSNSPGNQDTLIEMQNILLKRRENWDKHKKYQEEIHASEAMILNLEEELTKKEKDKLHLEEEGESIQAKIKKLETEHIAHTLRMSLKEGETCPVCGSKDHLLKATKVTEDGVLEELKKTHRETERRLQNLFTEITRISTSLELQEDRKEEWKRQLAELGEEFKERTVLDAEQKFAQKKMEIEEHYSKKTTLEKEVNEHTQQSNKTEIAYTTLNTSIHEKEEQLKKQNIRLSSIAHKYDEIKEKVQEEKKTLSVSDFIGKRDEISQMESEKSRIEAEIKQLRLTVNTLAKEGAALSKSASELREERKEKTTSHFEKSKQIEEKRNLIAIKVGEIKDLEKAKEDISNLITKIGDEYISAEKKRTEIEEKFQECNNKIISTQDNQISLGKRFETDRGELENALQEEKFDNIDEVKENLISKSQIVSLKREIEEYKNSITRSAVAIETLHKKQKGRSLTEEEWISLQKEMEEAAKKLKFYEEEKIKMEERIKSLTKKVQKKQELLLKKAEYDHKLAVLGDLESLFRGKKFVEFVAANQLKYVSLEASKKLKEITGGTYGLEVDENGKFLIRDYKNGGAARDATTLSGGETFLASLSLALALSAQIQLKGTAPLEFFFLDEGFGTLDDNLLEVVMDSLEKIHNDKLSIGIISHLEAIKNRIPVKLLVTSSEAGMGGSKVRIEIS